MSNQNPLFNKGQPLCNQNNMPQGTVMDIRLIDGEYFYFIGDFRQDGKFRWQRECNLKPMRLSQREIRMFANRTPSGLSNANCDDLKSGLAVILESLQTAEAMANYIGEHKLSDPTDMQHMANISGSIHATIEHMIWLCNRTNEPETEGDGPRAA